MDHRGPLVKDSYCRVALLSLSAGFDVHVLYNEFINYISIYITENISLSTQE